ncbi:hypothetical protein [Bradyrhizobium yuanmingense]
MLTQIQKRHATSIPVVCQDERIPR